MSKRPSFSDLSERLYASFEDFSSYLNSFKETLRNVFSGEPYSLDLNFNRGLSRQYQRQIMTSKPLAAFIPEEYGGRGVNMKECLSILETSSYQSLPLSLMLGINGGLFLQPVGKYGSREIKEDVFYKFLNHDNMGGLMITEPQYGSDALHMQTYYEEKSEHYRIKGTKHWAGLTGWANYWLLTARKKSEDGQLSRDVDFFVYDASTPGLNVMEYYQNLGLHILPYGKNAIDAKVPKENKLIPEKNGVMMMLDILHRSRLQFPGMAMGYLRRMLDEAVDHTKQRYVGGKSLFEYDQVKQRIAKLQSYFTTCSAMCAYTAKNGGVEFDLSRQDIPANSIKTIVTDYMHEAAQSLLQLVGAKGYRLDHIAGRSIVDSRPFQIFEGSNDILYQQVAESVLKQMKKYKLSNLYQFLTKFELTTNAAEYFKDTLNFEIQYQQAQNKIVELGKILGRVISLEMVLSLHNTGFKSDLINNCAKHLRHEVETLITSFQNMGTPDLVEDYATSLHWSNGIENYPVKHLK